MEHCVELVWSYGVLWRALADFGELWRTLADSGGLWRTLADCEGECESPGCALDQEGSWCEVLCDWWQ